MRGLRRVILAAVLVSMTTLVSPTAVRAEKEFFVNPYLGFHVQLPEGLPNCFDNRGVTVFLEASEFNDCEFRIDFIRRRLINTYAYYTDSNINAEDSRGKTSPRFQTQWRVRAPKHLQIPNMPTTIERTDSSNGEILILVSTYRNITYNRKMMNL
jgi:hypothetical protein